jgi:hypothetical protein
MFKAVESSTEVQYRWIPFKGRGELFGEVGESHICSLHLIRNFSDDNSPLAQ